MWHVKMNLLLRLSWTVHTVFNLKAHGRKHFGSKSGTKMVGQPTDRRGRTTLLVRIRPIRVVRRSVQRGHAIRSARERDRKRRKRRMPGNHELKYLALYPRQSPVDPCAVRLRFSYNVLWHIYLASVIVVVIKVI